MLKFSHQEHLAVNLLKSAVEFVNLWKTFLFTDWFQIFCVLIIKVSLRLTKRRSLYVLQLRQDNFLNN